MDVARVLDQLMRNIGFESGYVAQGGDIGSRICRELAVDYESCKGEHLIKLQVFLFMLTQSKPCIVSNL